MVRLQIRVLGGFSVALDGKECQGLASPRLRDLWCYLLLHRSHLQNRQQLACLFWPDSSESKARGSLSNVWYRLRRVLPEAETLFRVTHSHMGWAAEDGLWACDAVAFEEAIARSKTMTGQDRIAALEEALALYQGPLVPGCYEDWMVPLRESFLQQYRAALSQLAESWVEAGEAGKAIGALERLWRDDLLDERAARRMMKLYVSEGRRTEAHQVYQELSAFLMEELGVSPEQETQDLLDSLMREDSPPSAKETTTKVPSDDTDQNLASEDSSDCRWAALPVQLQPLVGREAELASLGSLFARPGVRLVTVVGMGGIGKTSVGLAFAHQQREAFADGVVFVPLAHLEHHDSMPGELAKAFGLSARESDEALMRSLHRLLADKACLLVLDNAEHLLGGVHLIEGLLRASRDLRVLVTSRQPLRISGEWLLELGGLALAETPEERPMSASVQLFARQFHQQSGRDILDDEEALAQAAAICEHVDGMPLGLELAAAWGRLLSLDEMVEAVTGELWVDTEELGPAGRDFATVFARSWKLLRPEQRTTLAGLSVFKGPFQSATAKAVTGASWSALLALRNHSLLQRHPQGGFLMHELVRQYAHHKLLEQPERHKETYEKACVHYQEQMARGKESWEAIERDFETVMSVFSWSCQHDGALLLDALPALYDAILGQGRFARGERWFEQMLVGLQADSPGPDGVALWTTLRGDLLVRQGVFFWYMAQITEAQSRCKAGVDLLRTVEAPSQLGFGLFCLGSIWTNRGRYQEARELLLESAALLREREGEESILLQVLRNLGYVALYTGAFAEGLDYFSEGLAHPYTRTDTLLHASMLGHQGMVQMRIEAYEDARASIQQSLVLQSAQSYPFERAYSLALLALVHACLASFDEAESCLDESLALFSQRPTMLHKWFALDTQTRFCCFREDWALAMSSNEQALEFFGSEDEFPRIVSQLLASRGYIMFHEGKLDEAQHDFLKGVRIACGSNQIEPLLENLVGVAACLQANEEQEEALSALCMAQSRAGLYGLFGRWARELRALSGVERETGPESEATGAAEAIFAYGEGLLL